MSDLDFGFLDGQWGFVLQGLLGTARLALTSLVAGTLIGLLCAAAQISGSRALRAVGIGFVELFRNIPVLVQIFWFYFTIPILTGAQPSAFAAAAIGISLYAGAYLAEIFRSGIQAVERTQWDGARAIGFGNAQAMRYVILPQAFRRILPPFTNQVLEIVKTTTVASTIAYADLLYDAKVMSEQEMRPVEAYSAIGGFFIVILLVASAGSSLLERRMARNG